MKLILLLGQGCGFTLLIHSSVGGRSHIKAMLEVGQTLAERGNRVSYVALDDNLRFAKPHRNLTLVGLGHRGLFVDTLNGILDSNCGGKLREDYDRAFSTAAVAWAAEAYRHEYRPLLNHVEIARPDVMLCDYFAMACNEIAVANAIPLVVGMQALDYLDTFNPPYLTNDPSFGPLTVDGLTFPRKVFDTFVVPYYAYRFWHHVLAVVNKERAAVNSGARRIPKGALHYGLGLVNSFFGFEVARELPPSVKVVGPILSSEVPTLSSFLGGFLTTHPRTMLVAFGSLISLRGREVAAILEGALNAMDEGLIDGLIWGLGRTSLVQFQNSTRFNHDFQADPRFQFLTWAPQPSLLNHPSVVIFLCHGGLESSFEAMHSRTPLLLLPFFADQARNAAKLQALGVGLPLDFKKHDIATRIRTLLRRTDLDARLDKARALTANHNRRREEAANHIEDHYRLALACRTHQPYTPTDNPIPCELGHLIPPSNHLGFIIANRLDVYLASFAIGIALLIPLAHLMRSIPTFVSATTPPL